MAAVPMAVDLRHGLGWDLHAAQAAWGSLERPEILTDRGPCTVQDGTEIAAIPEAGSLTVRGMSTVFKAPLMLTFYNQTQIVEAALPMDDGEFREADYETFNKSLCQFMDSVELAIHLPDRFIEN